MSKFMKSPQITEADDGRDDSVTPCKKGPYAWVPANCQEVDGNWYFLIKWKDTAGGWIGKAPCGTQLFHGHDGKVRIMNKQAKLFE